MSDSNFIDTIDQSEVSQADRESEISVTNSVDDLADVAEESADTIDSVGDANISKDEISQPKRRRRQADSSSTPIRRSSRLTAKKEEAQDEVVQDEALNDVEQPALPSKRAKTANSGATAKKARVKFSSDANTPKRLLGTRPFSSSGSANASTSPANLESVQVTQQDASAAETPSTAASLRRSKRQSNLRGSDGSSIRRTKYPEGEWISNVGKRGRPPKASTDEKSAISKTGTNRSNKKVQSPVQEGINDSSVGETEPKQLDEMVGSATSVTELAPPDSANAETAASASGNEDDDDDDDDDMPLAQIALDKKVMEMLSYKKESSSLLDESGHGVTDEISKISVAKTVEKKSDSDLFCADSDKEDDSGSDDEPHDATMTVEKTARSTLLVRKDVQLSPSEENTQYPCTICRQQSMVAQLNRCQNCPRYFHPKCVDKNRGNGAGGQDPARRRFCPKCLRSGPAAASSLLASSMAKRKQKKAKKIDSLVVTYRKRYRSGVSDVGGLAKSCPGCGTLRSETKQKRDNCEEYSIYCNMDCVAKTVQRTRRAMKGMDHERVLVMDATTGNVLDRKESPNLRNLSSWLREHMYCCPYNASTAAARRSSSPDVAGSPGSNKESGTLVKATSAVRLSAPASLIEQESSKLVASTIDTSKHLRISITREQQAPVDPGRLDVRKALRDVLLLRANETDDVLLTNDEIKQLAVDLEQEIQRAHKDDASYKQQCRSLISNLRSSTNKGLFRRLLNGELSTRRAATLTAAEMASTEYSYWAAAAEQERAEETERLKSVYMETSKLFSRTKVVTEADSTCDIFGLLHNDTTNDHKSHLFDLNCKICTGKQKDEDTPTPLRRERKDSSLPKMSTPVICRPEFGEKLIKREDGKIDIVYSVPAGRKSDPLHLESNISSSTAIEFGHGEEKTSPANVASRISHSKGSSASVAESSSKRSSLASFAEDDVPSAGISVSFDLPVPATLSTGKPSPAEKPSTVTRPIPPASTVPSFWHGILNMPQYFCFQTSFKPVSGPVHLLKRDLPSRLEIVGRIPPDIVYGYLAQIKKSGGKDIIIFRLPEPPLDDDKRQWDGLLSNIMQKQRFCVIDNHSLPMIKDFYLLSLAANEEPNKALLPFYDGPGLELPRKNTILGLVVRHRDRHGAESLPKKKLVEEDSPLDIASPSGASPKPKALPTKTEESLSKLESSSPQLDYMKIIKFPHGGGSSNIAGDADGGIAVKENPPPSEAKLSALSQPKLKQLLDGIDHAQNPTELANSIRNCLNQSSSTGSDTTVPSPWLPQKAESSSANASARIIADPRQKAVSATSGSSSSSASKQMGNSDKVATSSLAVESTAESDQEEKEKDSMNAWMNQMQSIMSSCMPSSQGQTKPALESFTGSSTGKDEKQGAGARHSNWQPMVPQPNPTPTSFSSTAAFAVPPPYIPAPSLPSQFGTTPFTRPPPPPMPSDFTLRPPPVGPGVLPPFMPGFAPPPVPPPTYPYSVPPPFLLAPPPPPPPQATATQAKALEEGEVSSSEEEVEDEDDERWTSRKAKSKRAGREDKKKNSKGGRSGWSRWDRTQPVEKSAWRQPPSRGQHGDSQKNQDSSLEAGGVYAQLNPIPEHKSGNAPAPATSTSGSSSTSGSGVILKQAFYGPRRSQGGNGGFSTGDQHRRFWK